MSIFPKTKLFNVTTEYRGDYPGGGGYDTIHTRVDRRIATRPQDAIAAVQHQFNYGVGTIVSLHAEEVPTSV